MPFSGGQKSARKKAFREEYRQMLQWQTQGALTLCENEPIKMRVRYLGCILGFLEHFRDAWKLG